MMASKAPGRRSDRGCAGVGDGDEPIVMGNWGLTVGQLCCRLLALIQAKID